MGVISSPDAVIELSEIRKSYRSGDRTVEALRGVDLVVNRGELMTIMGPSGSGKSTLLSIIGCLDRPTSGEYLLGGQSVARLRETELARIRNFEIGFVFQSFNLLPRATSLANVELPLVFRGVGAPERRRLAGEALEAVGLSDRADHRPGELSGGQCQRVAIARALVTRPRLLVADEPTGNLDSRTSEEILDLIVKLNDRGNTVIVVTHEEEVARRAKRILRLLDGKIVEDSRG